MRWVPPMWLAPGIIIIQTVTIFVPAFETWSTKRATRNYVSLLLSSTDTELGSSSFVTSPTSSAKHSIDIHPEISKTEASQSNSSIDSKLYSMHALRSALAINHKPLLDFAATKEFSAENILFLTRVKTWRSVWSTASANLTSPTAIPAVTLKHLFNSAVDIYIDLISEVTAEFPINIDFSTRKALDAVLEAAAVQRHGRVQWTGNVFDFSAPRPRMKAVRADTSDSEKTLFDNSETITRVDSIKCEEECGVVSMEPIGQDVKQDVDADVGVVIPTAFTEDIFDAAVKSIEYLVLTNTWPKFVKCNGVVLPKG